MSPPDFVVERGHVAMFARALGATTARTADRGASADGAELAPPTFLVAASHHDPQRPVSAAEIYARMSERYSTGAGLHAEQRFEFTRPVRVGDELTSQMSATRAWNKHGRVGGDLRFEERRVDWFDTDGAHVATATYVAVLTSQSAKLADRSARRSTAPGDSSVRESMVVASELTRAQIVMYAGASGDFNPVHIDEDFAVRVAGNPSVFAHGMLTMGLSGRALDERFGVERLRSFGARFLQPVWPGDTLDVELTVGAPSGELSDRIGLTTRNQYGDVVLVGTATISDSPAPQ